LTTGNMRRLTRALTVPPTADDKVLDEVGIA
jgi:hypothetical protein